MRYLTPTLVFILLVSLIANGVMWAKWRSHRAIMTVNGVGVSKSDMDNYLEQNFGPQYKAMMTQRILVREEARKKNISPTDAEVQQAFDETKELDFNFAEKMRQSPWLADETRNGIRQQIEQNRLVTHDVPVSPDEIAAEYQQNALRYDTPAKAKAYVAVLFKPRLEAENHEEDIFQLMGKSDPPVQPSTIMDNFRGSDPKHPEVIFLGNNNIFTFTQPFGATNQNSAIFTMKPGEVKKLAPPPEFASYGAAKIIVRLLEIKPGKKADLNDPKTKEKIQMAVAAKRATPLAEYLRNLFNAAHIESEDPNDKQAIQAVLFPEQNRAK